MHDLNHFTPYAERSLSAATSWAVGSHHHAYPERSIPNPTIESSQQLSGARMPNGSLYDPVLRQYQDLQNARDLTHRRTLNEHHVNLESRTGQYLKAEMGLPYQEHSRFSPEKALGFASRIFGSKSENLVDLFPGMEMQGAVRILKGVDPVNAQSMRKASALAELEVWAHGTGLNKSWVAEIQKGQSRPVQQLFESVVKETEVSSVLLSCCNIERSVISALPGKKAIYGLGLGYHNKAAFANFKSGGAFAWEHAVAVAEGEQSRIYTKGALYKELQKAGKLPAAVEDRGVIGIFKDAQGKTRLGANVLASSEADVLASSLPIESVPHITATTKKGTTLFEAAGQKFSSFEEAYKSTARGAPAVPVRPQANGSVVNRAAAESIPLQVAQEVHPTAALGAQTAEKIAARGTVNELHVNLESRVGGWLKKVMRLPFKKHSQVDSLAAALQGTRVSTDAGLPLRMFHGTATAFQQFKEGHGGGLYGPGFYFTSSPDIAGEYANARMLRFDEVGTERPNIRPAYLSAKNPLFMEAEADPYLARVAQRMARRNGELAELGPLRSNESVYRYLSSHVPDKLRGENPVAAELRIRRMMERRGYDSIAHTGGLKQGRGEVLHEVFVAFHPEQIHPAFGPSPSEIGPVGVVGTTPTRRNIASLSKYRAEREAREVEKKASYGVHPLTGAKQSIRSAAPATNPVAQQMDALADSLGRRKPAAVVPVTKAEEFVASPAPSVARSSPAERASQQTTRPATASVSAQPSSKPMSPEEYEAWLLNKGKKAAVSTSPASKPTAPEPKPPISTRLVHGEVDETANLLAHGGVRRALPWIAGTAGVGAVILGAFALLHHPHSESGRADHQQHTFAPDMDRGKHESDARLIQTDRSPSNPARSHVAIQVKDAPLNMPEVDRAYENHVTKGYAYS